MFFFFSLLCFAVNCFIYFCRWNTWKLVLKLPLKGQSTGRSSAWRMTVSCLWLLIYFWSNKCFTQVLTIYVSVFAFLFFHTAVLYFLLQVSFLVDEGVSPVLLQLLSCALCGSKVLASSSSTSSSFSGGGSGSAGQTGASQSSQSKSSSKKSKKEDKEKEKDGEKIKND